MEFEDELQEQPRFGGTISGVVPISNDGGEIQEGLFIVDLVSDLGESKKFGEEIFDSSSKRVKIAPLAEEECEFHLQMPQGLAPGRQLYIRARMNETTVALHQLVMPSSIHCRLEARQELSVGDEFTIYGLVHNVDKEALSNVRVALNVPCFVEIKDRATQVIDAIDGYSEHRVEWKARAVAPMEAGTLTFDVQPEAGSSSRSFSPIRIVGEQAGSEESTVPAGQEQ